MKRIKLTQDKVTLIDDVDYAEMSVFKWCYSNGYAARRAPPKDGKVVHLYMHRMLMNAQIKDVVMHVDGNKLNNRRDNLKVITRAARHHIVASRSASGLKGVTAARKLWTARLTIDKKSINLGIFHDKLDAARAYDRAALKYYGSNAVTNYPKEMYPEFNHERDTDSDAKPEDSQQANSCDGATRLGQDDVERKC